MAEQKSMQERRSHINFCIKEKCRCNLFLASSENGKIKKAIPVTSQEIQIQFSWGVLLLYHNNGLKISILRIQYEYSKVWLPGYQCRATGKFH